VKVWASTAAKTRSFSIVSKRYIFLDLRRATF